MEENHDKENTQTGVKDEKEIIPRLKEGMPK
jgi:hypothetical protein